MAQSPKIVPVQICRTAQGWVPVEVESSVGDGSRYVVLVCPWGNAVENICECAGYAYRGRCRHQVEAMDLLCGWMEVQRSKFSQSPEQRKAMVCPRCGGPTSWTLEVEDDV